MAAKAKTTKNASSLFSAGANMLKGKGGGKKSSKGKKGKKPPVAKSGMRGRQNMMEKA
jgi:hypothetical protein